jgi:hypothetical protein
MARTLFPGLTKHTLHAQSVVVYSNICSLKVVFELSCLAEDHFQVCAIGMIGPIIAPVLLED